MRSLIDDRQQPPLLCVRAMNLVEIFGDDCGAGYRGPVLGRQDRRGAGGIEREIGFAPFPGALFHQPQIEAVFAEDQANEA